MKIPLEAWMLVGVAALALVLWLLVYIAIKKIDRGEKGWR